jgi:hypothetical protein
LRAPAASWLVSIVHFVHRSPAREIGGLDRAGILPGEASKQRTAMPDGKDRSGADDRLFRLAGFAALGAGALRIVSALIPFESGSLGLEALYAAIDVGLLFGTIGICLDHRGALGPVGLTGAAVLLCGVASIVGPDTTFLGVDTYAVGVRIIALGVVLTCVPLILARRMMLGAALLVLSVAVGGVGPFVGLGDVAWTAAGVLFGGGYCAGGWDVIRRHW